MGEHGCRASTCNNSAVCFRLSSRAGIRRMLIDTHVERHAAFAKHGFQFARGLVDSEDLLRALNSVALDVRSGRPSDGNGGARGAHCIHSSEAGNYLFEKLTPKIVELVGSSVVP